MFAVCVCLYVSRLYVWEASPPEVEQIWLKYCTAMKICPGLWWYPHAKVS